jgi:hypothetical protein
VSHAQQERLQLRRAFLPERGCPHPQRVEYQESVQDNFNAGWSGNVLRLGQPRSIHAARNSGNASTSQHNSLERVVRHERNAPANGKAMAKT